MALDLSDLPTRDGMYLRDAIGGQITDLDDAKRQVLVTFPHDTIDTFKTTFDPNCFRESFETRKPLVCWQHDLRDPIGHAIDAQVRAKSNDLVGQLDDFDAVPHARRAWSQIQSGTITDFSFGFRQPKYEPHRKHPGVRNIRSAIMMEFSPVSVGSIPGAVATGLREEDIEMAEQSLTAQEIIEAVRAELISKEDGQRMLAELDGFRGKVTIRTPEQIELEASRDYFRSGNWKKGEPPPWLKDDKGGDDGDDKKRADDAEARVTELEAELEGVRAGTLPDKITAENMIAALPQVWQDAVADAAIAIGPAGTNFFREDAGADLGENASIIANAIDTALSHAGTWLKDVDLRSQPEEVQQAALLLAAAAKSSDALLDVLGVDPQERAVSPYKEPINKQAENMSSTKVKCDLCGGKGETEDGKTCPKCMGTGVEAMTRAGAWTAHSVDGDKAPHDAVDCPVCAGRGRLQAGMAKTGAQVKNEMSQPDPGDRTKAHITDDPSWGKRADGDEVLTEDNSIPCDACRGEGWVTEGDFESLNVRAVPSGWSTTPWENFSQADYTPEQWKRACLIVRGDGSTKDQCSLPVKEPNGNYNVNGIAAAAGRLGSVGDVSSSERQDAASTLVTLYRKLGRDLPPSLAEETQRDETGVRIAGEEVDPIALRDAALEKLNKRVPAKA